MRWIKKDMLPKEKLKSFFYGRMKNTTKQMDEEMVLLHFDSCLVAYSLQSRHAIQKFDLSNSHQSKRLRQQELGINIHDLWTLYMGVERQVHRTLPLANQLYRPKDLQEGLPI